MNDADEATVQRVAEAIYNAADCNYDAPWCLCGPYLRDVYRSMARAALAAAGVRERPSTAESTPPPMDPYTAAVAERWRAWALTLRPLSAPPAAAPGEKT